MLKITRILISQYLQRFGLGSHNNRFLVYFIGPRQLWNSGLQFRHFSCKDSMHLQRILHSVVKSNSGSKRLNSLNFWKQSKEYCSQYSLLFEKLYLTFQQYVSIQHGNLQIVHWLYFLNHHKNQQTSPLNMWFLAIFVTKSITDSLCPSHAHWQNTCFLQFQHQYTNWNKITKWNLHLGQAYHVL
jgi:hypothetical protein